MSELGEGEVETLVVRRFRAAVEKHIGAKDMMAGASLVRAEHLDAFVLSLVAYMAASTVHRGVTASERVPVSWWDAFKAAWFPEWLLCRFPARTRAIETRVEFVHVCPHLPPFYGNELCIEFLRPLDGKPATP